MLELRVERRCRLVEHQNSCILHERAGDGDALAFAAGQLDALLAHDHVIAFVALRDEVVRKGLARGFDHLAFLRERTGIADIVAHVAMEDAGHLRHLGDRFVQRIPRDMADVLAVDQDAALLRFELTPQETHQRRLAGARRADEADPLARLDVEIEILEHLIAVGMAEADIFKPYMCRARRPAAVRRSCP